MKRVLIGLASVGVLLAANRVITKTLQPTARESSQFEKNKANAEKVYKDLQKEKHEKEMRETDHTHEGRPQIAPGVSVGGSLRPPSGNVRVSIDPPPAAPAPSAAPTPTPAPATPAPVRSPAPPAVAAPPIIDHSHGERSGGHERPGWAGPDRGSDRIGRTV